jgi:hypothetical protein
VEAELLLLPWEEAEEEAVVLIHRLLRVLLSE